MLFDGEIVKEEFFVHLFRVKIIFRIFMVIFSYAYIFSRCGMKIKRKISLENFTLKFIRVTLKPSERLFLNRIIQKSKWSNYSEVKEIDYIPSLLHSFTNLT